MAAALLSIAAAGPLCAQEGAPDRLDAYLLRLGLADLRLRHLERQAEGEPDGETKLAAGRKLADAYAERLMSLAEDEGAFKGVMERVQRLLVKIPQARTPALSVMLLQAEFQRAESLVNSWLDEPSAAAAAPREGVEILLRIVPELERRAKELNEAAEALLTADDVIRTQEAQQEMEQTVFRMQAIAARAGYFAGWGRYYLGLTRSGPDAATDFTAAKQYFADVLGVVDEMDYSPIEADSLGLESIWRARTAIGLGLAESALGRLDAAAACFRWLDHASAPADLRDAAVYWQLRGLLNVRNLEAAAELAEVKIAGMAMPPTPGKNSLCTSLLQAGTAHRSAPAPGAAAAANRLLIAGINGLARLRQFDTLSQLAARYKLDTLPETKDSFYLAWLSGRSQFLAAEKTKKSDDYQAAAEILEAALAQHAAREDLFAAAQCRYYLAWCRFRLEEFEAAAQAFHEVTPVLREGEQELAVQSNWMEFAAWQTLAQKSKEPRYAAAAVAALESLKRDFPDSEQATKADIYIARLQQDASPERAIESLAKVKPGDAGYAAAQLEIAILRHRIWKEAGGDKEAGAKLAVEVLAAADRFLSIAGTSGRVDERLRASLMAAEVLLVQGESETGEVERYLRQASQAVGSLGASHPLLPEFHYRRLQYAQRIKDDALLRETAAWIADHGTGTPYELPALVIVARNADAAVDAAGAETKRTQQEAAAAIYERLTAQLGDSPEAIAGGKNALAANSRLAGYHEALGRWKEAAARLDKIAAAFPSDKKYLRRAGIAHVQAGNHAAAVDHWRKLLGGLSGGSDDWLEAKYYQISCLLATDRAAAEKVWKQFRLLYPQVKSAAWKPKFDELSQRLDGSR